MKLIKKYYKAIIGIGVLVILSIGIGIAQILINNPKQSQVENGLDELKKEEIKDPENDIESEIIEENEATDEIQEGQQEDTPTSDIPSNNTTKPNTNNSTQNNNTNTSDDTTKPNMSDDTQNNNMPKPNTENNTTSNEVNDNTQDESIKEKLLGIWNDKDNRVFYIFEDDKFTIINVSYNHLSNYEYEIRGNSIVYDEQLLEAKFIDNTLYLGKEAYFKQSKDFQLPFIYYNIDKVLGTTWKMTKGDNVIYRYEDEPPIVLETEITFTKNNIFGYGMCVGVCENIYNFKNNKIEIYMNNIHFEMIDDNTLVQVPYGSYPDYGIEYTRIK